MAVTEVQPLSGKMETGKPGPPLRVAGAALAKGRGSFQSDAGFPLLAAAGYLSGVSLPWSQHQEQIPFSVPWGRPFVESSDRPEFSLFPPLLPP